MASFSQVEAFIEHSKRISTPKALKGLLADITSEMGFDFYALMHHVELTPEASEMANRPKPILLGLTNYPEAWVEVYLAQNLAPRDPILLASDRSSVGFSWEDLSKHIEVTAEHREITSAARSAGVEHGYTVPARVPGEPNGSCSFATKTGRRLPRRNLLMAQMVGTFAFQAARSMVLEARGASKPAARSRLTTRQLECLVLVGKGKTDWEIGQIMGLHEQTVTDHLDEARRRCGAARRTQLLVYALYNKYITLDQVYDGTLA